jgi:hypothetical protein
MVPNGWNAHALGPFRGRRVGEWTTYDKAGAVYKVTRMKAGPSSTTADGSLGVET